MKLCMGCMEQIEDHLSTCPYCGFNEMELRQEAYYLDPGTVIGGKYIVGRVLSYGGHTVSYLGMDAEKNRKVIVKEYLPSDFSTRSEGEKEVTIYSGDGQEQFEQGLTNFLNEANRIQRLQGVEEIAKVYDCIAENETGYVISEYVEGKTLKEILEGGKKYSVREAARFIRELLKGLEKVHHMDIVHCDISPETIMVTDTGDIKLTDFGATRYVTTANSKSLSIILKRGYAPEEQYRSKGKRGPWTDVYAVGAVMYRMLTGIVPQESVERALSDDLKEPSKLGVPIPKDMENALMNALNVYQKDRTPSAEAFLKELSSTNVKRRKVKQKKNKTGRFPLWAKGLVAALVCVVLGGGAFVLLHERGNDSDMSHDVVQMEDFRGKSEEDLRAYIQKLNEEHSGWEITLDSSETLFDRNQKSGTVCRQSVEAGTVLYDPAKEEQELEAEGLTCDAEGNVKGTISVTVSSKEKLRYSESKGLNAYELAKKLGISTADENCFIAEEGSEDHEYFELASIEAGGKEIFAQSLWKAGNEDKEIPYSTDIRIHYYATDFFYWKKLPDFAKKYGKIEAVPEQSVYCYADETKRQKTEKKSLADSSLVDDGYWTLSDKGYEEGDIAGQTVEPGETYDESHPGDTPLEIQVIGKVLKWKEKTGSEFAEELDALGYSGYILDTENQDGVEPNREWKISKVIIYKKGKNGGIEIDESGKTINETMSYFKRDSEDVILSIIVEKPQPQTQPQPQPSYTTIPNSNHSTGATSDGHTVPEQQQ